MHKMNEECVETPTRADDPFHTKPSEFLVEFSQHFKNVSRHTEMYVNNSFTLKKRQLTNAFFIRVKQDFSLLNNRTPYKKKNKTDNKKKTSKTRLSLLRYLKESHSKFI